MQAHVSDGQMLQRIIEDKPIAGSGHCKACGCRGYRPNTPKNDYCRDCGHSWYLHESVG